MENSRNMNINFMPYFSFLMLSLIVFYVGTTITKDIFNSSIVALLIGLTISIILTYIVDYRTISATHLSFVDSLPLSILILALLILGVATALNFYFKVEYFLPSIVGHNIGVVGELSLILSAFFIFSSQVLSVFVYTVSEWSLAIFLDIDVSPQRLLKANVLCYLLYAIPVVIDYTFTSFSSYDIHVLTQIAFNVAILTKTIEIIVVFLYSVVLKLLSDADDKRVILAAITPNIVIGSVVIYILPKI